MNTISVPRSTVYPTGGIEVRFHRGGLDESVKTKFKPTSWEDFIEKCRKEDSGIITSSIESKLYQTWLDSRVGWEVTWIISARHTYCGKLTPIAFASGDVDALRHSYFL
jgi:hypothetical protein